MPKDAANPHAIVFLSYRRDDTQWAARGIYEQLCSRYGRDNVFRDLDAIPSGVKFRDFIQRKISESDVFILLIGKAWSSIEGEGDRRRLEMPRDPVRQEIEAALQTGMPIIPVRVDGALMPKEQELVPSIVDLLEFNSTEVTDSRFDYDISRLLMAIDVAVQRNVSAPSRYRRPPASSSAGGESRLPRTDHLAANDGRNLHEDTWTQTRLATVQDQFRHLLFYGGIHQAEVDKLVYAVAEKAISAVNICGHDGTAGIVESELRVDWIRHGQLTLVVPAIHGGLPGWLDRQSPEILVIGRRFKETVQKEGLIVGWRIKLAPTVTGNSQLRRQWDKYLKTSGPPPQRWKGGQFAESSYSIRELEELDFMLRLSG